MSERTSTWPDNICAGQITYGKANNYDGFYLADAAHGIPTIGSVSPTDPVTIRGQTVHVFNYPAQTEAIAAQLVLRWNFHDELVDAVDAALGHVRGEGPPNWDWFRDLLKRIHDAALSKAKAQP